METRNNNSLLSMALGSLNTDARAERRNKIYQENVSAVELVKKTGLSTVYDVLAVKPSVKGKVEGQSSLPLVASNAVTVGLDKIHLPANLGGDSLKAYITRLCREHNIDTSHGIETASLHAVVAAIPGQHAENDLDCKDVTQAEFAPVYHAGHRTQRVLALCYSVNGETGMRRDHLRVYNEMACLNSANNRESALKAIEIPNALAAEMQTQQPAVFDQLQKSSSVMVFLEYALDEYRARGGIQLESTSGYRTRGGGGMEKGISKGMSKGGDDFEDQSAFASRGVSAYSVIGQGNSVQDKYSTVSEQGDRRLTGIKIYVMGMMVVNTQGQTFLHQHAENVSRMLRARADELQKFYEQYRIFRYNNLVQDLRAYLAKYQISTSGNDIVEHSILRLGGITEEPTACKFSSSDRFPDQYFYLDLGISHASAVRLAANLKDRFGADFCDHTPEHNQGRTQSIRVSLQKFRQNYAAIHASIDEVLSTPRALLAYQKYSNGSESTENLVIRKFASATNDKGLSLHDSDIFEITFARMFGCFDDIKTARFQAPADYVGKKVDLEIYLPISADAAIQIVEAINRQYPEFNPAKLLSSSARLEDKGNVIFCRIVLDGQMVLSEKFHKAFVEKLEWIKENMPQLVDQIRCASNHQRMTTSRAIETLNNIIHKLVDSGNGNTGKLVSALQVLRTVLENSCATQTNRLEASDEVRKSIATFEATQTRDENRLFKRAEKAQIKELQSQFRLK